MVGVPITLVGSFGPATEAAAARSLRFTALALVLVVVVVVVIRRR
jgi:hypothetical protein